MNPITCKEAKALGLKRYFTGKPCPHGHVSERISSNGGCVRCLHLASNALAKKTPEKQKIRRARWRQADPERFLANSRKWAELRKELTKVWAANNPYRRQCAARNYYIKKSGAEGKFTADDINKLKIQQSWTCLCGFDLHKGFHVDHKMPLSRGGSNWPSNLQLLCARCNTSKGAKTMEEWRCAA